MYRGCRLSYSDLLSKSILYAFFAALISAFAFSTFIMDITNVMISVITTGITKYHTEVYWIPFTGGDMKNILPDDFYASSMPSE